jgi:hypothetical protein
MVDENTGALPVTDGQDAPDSTEQPAPYFETLSPDGKKETFGTRADLEKAWKDSYMRTSDYTRKTQEVSRQRAEHEKALKDFAEQQKVFAKNKMKYDEWDQLLKSRPQVARQLMQMGQSPAAPGEVYERAQSYADEKYKALEDKLTAFEQEREKERFQRELDGAMTTLSGEYPDFDRDAVMNLLGEVSNGDTATLLKHLYFAHKGTKSPIEAEKRVVEGIERKRQAGIMPSSKVSPPSNGRAPKTIKEARLKALAELGGG